MGRRGRLLVWLTAALLVAIGVAGVLFVVAAGFDDAAKVAVGSSLLTGLVVGLAVSWADRVRSDTRRREAAAAQESNRDSMAAAAYDRLGMVPGAVLQMYWLLLARHRDHPVFVYSPPSGGFRDSDVAEVHALVQATIERMIGDVRWWKDQRNLALVDAVSYVASDLVERLSLGLDAGGADDHGPRRGAAATEVTTELLRPVEHAINQSLSRAARIADRLAEDGDVTRAFALDNIVDALAQQDELHVYAPKLEDFLVIRNGVSFSEGRVMAWPRTVVSWCIDQMRPDRIDVDQDDRPLRPMAIPLVVYRWGPVLGPDIDSDSVWENRFEEGSWLRAEFTEAHRYLRHWSVKATDEPPGFRL